MTTTQQPATQPVPAPAQAPAQPVKITPEMLKATNYPKAAFYLSAFAGVMMLVAGLFAIFFDSIYLAINWSAWAGLTSLFIGILLVIDSMILSGAAASLLLKPEMRKTAGVTIILFSLLAFLMGFGWLWVVGAGFGIVGGILALIWKPKTA
jgi:hypothetical protein